MDVYDQASERELFDRNVAVMNSRKPEVAAQATGLCLWCEDHVEPGHRWCNLDCQLDYLAHGGT